MTAGTSPHRYVHFEVTIPTEINERARELIEEFGNEQPQMDDDARTRRSSGRR
jgi:DnaJ-class molecular chaperone